MSLARRSGLYVKPRKEFLLVAPDHPPPTPMRPPGDPSTIVLLVGGPLGLAEAPLLCDQIRSLLECSEAALVVCDVAALTDPDLATVDALARLALTARRVGCRVTLRRAAGELQELLALAGLRDVVTCSAGLPVEVRGQTKQRKEPRGVEEKADPADPTG